MTRLEKKCIVGAAGLHGLLVVIVVVASAFQGEPPKQQSFVPITWVTTKLTDSPSVMAGNPNAAPVAVKAPTPAPVAQPTPEKAQPQPEKTKPDPAPEKTEAKPVKHQKHEVEPNLDSLTSSKADARPTRPVHKLRSADDIKVDLGHTTKVKPKRPTHSDTGEADARAAAEAQREAANEISHAMGNLAHAIKTGTAKPEVFDIPGQSGNAAFANYRDFVASAFTDAWACPQEVDNELSSVDVKVVVAKNGTVISATIIKKSSESALNKSVQRALERVRKLPPFPEGATEDQRSFNIRFNLKAKQSLG